MMVILRLFSDFPQVFWITAFVSLTLYTLVMIFIGTGVWALPPIRLKNTAPFTRFSLIIPFKDEAENLPALLKSLKQLKYPAGMYEILLVDDHSTDMSAQIVQESGFVRYVAGQGEGKKQALLSGIKEAQYDWIVTTDADGTVPPDWLMYFHSAIITAQPKMILGPVKFIDQNTFLSKFQQFEFLSLQAMTIAGVYWKHPFLSNGANFAFDKQAFYAVNAYGESLKIASGDDVFLLEKFQKKYAGKITFVKNPEAVVSSMPQPDFKALIQQKIRWAGKTKYQKSLWPKLAGILILSVNFFLLAAWIFGGFESKALIFIGVKFIFDTWLVFTMSKMYRLKFSLFAWMLTFLIYPVYLIYTGIQSFQGGYQWKGRRHKY